MPSPTLTPALIRAVFDEALTQEFGMALPLDPAYHRRSEQIIHTSLQHHPERDKIIVCGFPAEGEFWFVKKTVEVI